MYWYDNLIRRFLSCSLLIHQQCHIVLTICTTHIHHLQVTQKGSHITNSVFAATKILFRHLIAIAHTPTATFHQSNKNFMSASQEYTQKKKCFKRPSRLGIPLSNMHLFKTEFANIRRHPRRKKDLQKAAWNLFTANKKLPHAFKKVKYF